MEKSHYWTSFAAHFFEERSDLVIARDVTGKKWRLFSKFADQFLDVFFQTFALVIKNQASAGRGPSLRDRLRDAPFVRHAKSDTCFFCQNLLSHKEERYAALPGRRNPKRFPIFDIHVCARLRLKGGCGSEEGRSGESFVRFRSEIKKLTSPKKGTTIMHNLILGNRRALLRLAFPFTTLAVMCFAFLPLTHAVTPAPDGGYGGNNTAEGDGALSSLTTGVWNTALGFQALFNDTTGSTNTATGYKALNTNTAGGGNTAIGSQALLNNTGAANIALGANAGVNITTGNANIDIGNAGSNGDSDTVRIGKVGTQTNAFIAGIFGVPVVNGLRVVVDNVGHLGTEFPSAARFKEAVKPMDKASEAILALKPVTFRYKKELDPKGVPQFGLVAEEVAKVNPDLVARDVDGRLQTVRYDAVNAMLLNEFLKEHQTVQELTSAAAKQEAKIALQEQEIKSLTAALKEQASQIQKVSAQLEVNKPAPQIVLTNQ
jgi:hypothetical protein